MVGFWLVLQHTPRAVTSEPLEEVTLPPQIAFVSFMELIAAVLTYGTSLEVAKSNTFP